MSPAPHSLDPAVTAPLFDALRRADAAFASRFPGEPARRQPVHTIYGGAHLFKSDGARRLGDVALKTLERYAPDARAFGEVFGLPDPVAATVRERVVEKLEREPVEDLRVDFEDGYGYRPDDEEDRDATRVGEQLAQGVSAGTLPPFVGVRVKALTATQCERAARTLDLVLTALARSSADALPERFVVTLPKVTAPEQPAAAVKLCEALERALALGPGSLALELMIETPQSLVDARGACALPALYDACEGRCAAVHFGAYDFTAALDVAAPDQRLDHPACDHARRVMQTALAGRGVFLADGATNVLPVGPHRGDALTEAQARANRDAVHAGWRLHARHVRASIAQGFHQSWDLHPAQLVSRYAAVHAFYVDALADATARLRAFVDRAAKATLVGSVFDDAATGQGLLNFFLRGLACGALREDEALATGLSRAELDTRSFERIVQGRAR